MKATCRDCGKVVGVVPAADPPRFAGHRRPTGGMCLGSAERVLKRDLIHPCRRCAALPARPEHPAFQELATEHRPATPRPVKARGYCASHLRDVIAEERQRERDRRRAKRYGITPVQFAELVAAQGGTCACGLTHARSRRKGVAVLALATDHDHARQAECVRLGRHDDTTCCEHCVRGGLGRRCNTEIIGRFTSDQLRRLADYQDHPTAERLGWWNETDDDDDDDEETGT